MESRGHNRLAVCNTIPVFGLYRDATTAKRQELLSRTSDQEQAKKQASFSDSPHRSQHRISSAISPSMVHTGKPSRGCAVCRRRRIKVTHLLATSATSATPTDKACKCDEKLPECSYCIKTQQTCPGYKDTFELAWRDQTSVAMKASKDGKMPRKSSEHLQTCLGRDENPQRTQILCLERTLPSSCTSRTKFPSPSQRRTRTML